MATPNIYNLLIQQGSSFNDLTFQLVHKCLVRCPVKPSSEPAIIKIEPMGITLPVGSILISGCDDLVLAAPMLPEDRSIQVTSVPSSISNGSGLIGSPVDITDWQVRSSIRDKANLIIANFVGIVTDSLKGKYKLTLSDTVTASIKPNCTWRDYQGIDISLLGQPLESLSSMSVEAKKRFKKLSDDAYRWDVETIDSAQIVSRRFEGLVLVSGEVTAG